MLVATLILATASYGQPTVQATWEKLGKAPFNPKEASASSNLLHAYWTEHDRPNQRVRFHIDGATTDWKPGLTMLLWASDGQTYYWLEGKFGERQLWVNGKPTVDGLDNGTVLASKPLTAIVGKQGRTQLIVDSKVVQESKDLAAFVTDQGTFIHRQEEDGRYTMLLNGKTYVASAEFVLFELTQKRVLTWTNGEARINGTRIADIPKDSTDVMIRVSHNNAHWFLLSHHKTLGPRLWLDGERVTTIPNRIADSEDIPYTRFPLLCEPQVDDREDITGYRLFRALPSGAVSAFGQPVGKVCDGGYTESEEGKHFAVLAELDDDGTYGIIRDKQLVWKGTSNFVESTELNGISLNKDGSKLAYVTEEAQNQFWVHVNQEKFGPYSFVVFQPSGLPSVLWSPDGKRFAYAVQTSNDPRTHLYIGGKRTEINYDRELQYGDPRWTDANTIQMMVGKDGSIYRVTVKVP